MKQLTEYKRVAGYLDKIFNLLNDAYFENVCRMIESYFKMGGLHVQLNYVSKEILQEARKAPEKHPNLKVRVSGFSANFVGLNEKIQEEIICRTNKKG